MSDRERKREKLLADAQLHSLLPREGLEERLKIEEELLWSSRREFDGMNRDFSGSRRQFFDIEEVKNLYHGHSFRDPFAERSQEWGLFVLCIQSDGLSGNDVALLIHEFDRLFL